MSCRSRQQVALLVRSAACIVGGAGVERVGLLSDGGLFGCCGVGLGRGHEGQLRLVLFRFLRDVVVIDRDRCRILTDWHRPEGARVDRRVVELRGQLAPGTRLSDGAEPFALYEIPAPFPATPHPRMIHVPRTVKVVDVLEDGVVVEEYAVQGFTWQELPVALTPAAPPKAGSQQAAIDEWADGVIAADPGLPEDPATDLLLRRAPRLPGGLVRGGEDDVADIAASLAALDRSYLAVQGPPGTGKTYVGSHVVARLVAERGFRVGVVAQSHAVVEHMLDRIVDAGVPRAQVAKAPKSSATGDAADLSFTPIAKNGMAEYIGSQSAGFVVGGTAWDFSHPGRIARGGLDLLVIDEAGQFSLASTIAVSVAAPCLLLLGDPQQLPQVSQGTHPEPVDTSALGWVMDGAAVIDADRGYFLAQTRRMRPEVAEAVSQLSYEGRLAAHPSTSDRLLEGVPAGIVTVPLGHTGNATQSPEEAAQVVELVRGLVGRAWHPGDGDARPLLRSAVRVSSSTSLRCSAVSARIASPSIAACASRSREPRSVSSVLAVPCRARALTTHAAAVGLRLPLIRRAASASPLFLAAAASFVRSAVKSSGLAA